MGSEIKDTPKSTADLWSEGLEQLQHQLAPGVFTAFISPLKLKAVDQGAKSVTISAPSRLVGAHVERNYRDLVAKVFASLLGQDVVTVLFDIDSSPSDAGGTTRPAPQYVVVHRQPQSSPGRNSQVTTAAEAAFWLPKNLRYTFSTFLPGPSNNLAFRAARGVASMGGRGFSPLVIYGAPGLGKSHLLHAIANDVADKRVGITSAEHFTNELVRAIKDNKTAELRAKFRSLDILLVDDVQFLGGKTRIQEEFLFTFDALEERGKTVILCADRAPKRLAGFEPRLLSRLCGGLSVEIEKPNTELLSEIVSLKAKSLELPLDRESIAAVAAAPFSSIREVEGVLNRLLTVSSLLGSPIDAALAKKVVREMSSEFEKPQVTVEDIRKATANCFGMRVADLSSKCRSKNVALPRHIAMYLCRKHTTLSYPEIGKVFGGRDHSSVIHSVQAVTERLPGDEMLQKRLTAIETALGVV